jgi:hypothetical protein
MNLREEFFSDRTFRSLFDLLGGIYGDVTKAKQLTRQPALIDVVTRTNQTQLFA